MLKKLPDPTEMRKSTDDLFSQFGISNCPRGIDGSQIRLENAPAQADLPAGVHPEDFWFSKQFSPSKLKSLETAGTYLI